MERQFEKILLKHGWGKIPNWECLFVHREKGLFLSVYVDDIKLAGKKHNIDPMWKVRSSFDKTIMEKQFEKDLLEHCWETVPNLDYSCLCMRTTKKMAGKKQNVDPMWKVPMKQIDLGESTSSLDHVDLACTQREFETSKDSVDNYEIEFPQEQQKHYLAWGNLMRTSLHGPVRCKVMQRNEWSGIASWPINQLSNFSKSQLHALMTINSEKKNWDLWENCQEYALKLS